jgi:hypothetical protein
VYDDEVNFKMNSRRDVSVLLSNFIQSIVDQAQNVVGQLQGHASNLSQQAIQQVSNLIEQLRAVATLAHGKVLSTIEGLIATLQGFRKTRNKEISLRAIQLSQCVLSSHLVPSGNKAVLPSNKG